MVKELIALVPQMVFLPDRNGSYLLHIAIHNQQNYDVVYELFKACPEVVSIHDVNTNLLLFMLAAVGNWNDEKDQMTITY